MDENLSKRELEEVEYVRLLDPVCPFYYYDGRLDGINIYWIYFSFEYKRVVNSVRRFEACYRMHGTINFSYLTENKYFTPIRDIENDINRDTLVEIDKEYLETDTKKEISILYGQMKLAKLPQNEFEVEDKPK